MRPFAGPRGHNVLMPDAKIAVSLCSGHVPPLQSVQLNVGLQVEMLRPNGSSMEPPLIGGAKSQSTLQGHNFKFKHGKSVGGIISPKLIGVFPLGNTEEVVLDLHDTIFIVVGKMSSCFCAKIPLCHIPIIIISLAPLTSGL